MSLYSKSDTITPAVLTSDFLKYHAHASVISVENASVFLGSTKDALRSFGKLFTSNEEQRPFTDACKNRYEVVAKAKIVRFSDFRHRIVSKPESFKGLYVEYAKDLYDSGVLVNTITLEATDKLKMLLATFINEYKDNQVDDVYGYLDFKKIESRLEAVKKTMKAYFTAPVNKVKATPDMVMRNMGDIETVYDKLNLLGAIFSHSTLAKINSDVNSVTDLVDSLIKHNTQSGVLTRNNDTKKQLMECIHISGLCVEFYSALYAQSLMFCTAFKNLTDELKEMD